MCVVCRQCLTPSPGGLVSRSSGRVVSPGSSLARTSQRQGSPGSGMPRSAQRVTTPPSILQDTSPDNAESTSGKLRYYLKLGLLKCDQFKS